MRAASASILFAFIIYASLASNVYGADLEGCFVLNVLFVYEAVLEDGFVLNVLFVYEAVLEHCFLLHVLFDYLYPTLFLPRAPLYLRIVLWF